jgi:hypothetical protein
VTAQIGNEAVSNHAGGALDLRAHAIDGILTKE